MRHGLISLQLQYAPARAVELRKLTLIPVHLRRSLKLIAVRPSPSSQPPGSPGFPTTVLALGALFNGLFNHLPQQRAALHNILRFKNIFEPELERERFGFSPRIAF